ncbi:shikimate kinase [Eleftheria terrae]|uniref:shikimate kinase n=1 Tax=Eleftheria terrae TaxID=1597781 RepID=UPI00263A93BD|nr:shikimate kinase [Eleftheria terrae]WKB51930.1 shikimate kinase [Eleftheria terrae]
MSASASAASIALVGLPGSGKSTVGRQLARRCGLPFVDSDAVIEERLGEPIRSFFDREGEDRFRDVEEQVLAEVASRGGVLSTGGGAVLRPANRRLLKEHAVVVYLYSTPEELFRRLRHDTQRPLLQVSDPLAKLRSLHGQRDPLYRECADFIVETGRPSVTALVNLIQMQLELSGAVPPVPPAQPAR